MTFNFPNAPILGQTFAPADGPLYVWDGSAWRAIGPGAPATVRVGDTPPANPVAGQLWWESDSGKLFIWFVDPDSAAWVHIFSGPAGPIGPPGTGFYDTLVGLAAVSVPHTVNAIRTAGYSVVGDGGGALYKRVVSAPAHAGKVQSMDGAWWEIAGQDVYIEQFGAIPDGNGSNGGTDNYAVITAALAFAEATGRALRAGPGTFRCASGLVFDNAVKFVGDSRGGTIIDMSGVTSGEAIYVAKNAIVSELYLGHLQVIGHLGATGLKTGTDITKYLTDSRFEHLKFSNFAVGLSMTYAWQNVFANCRWQSCTKPFAFASQSNSTHFDTVSFVSFSTAGTFSNAEGLAFTSANISNASGASAFTLFQSNVVMRGVYFESIAADLALVGSASEAFPSQLVIEGGIYGGSIKYANDATIIISGVKVTANGLLVKQAAASPREYTRNLHVNVNSPNFTQRRGEVILDVTHDRPVILTASSGGSARTVALYRDHFQMTQTTAANGYELSGALVIGQQYTLAHAIRKKVDITTLALKAGAASSLAFLCPLDTELWEIRCIYFTATDPVLDLVCVGTLEVKLLRIYEGIVNTTLEMPVVNRWRHTAAPTVGTWVQGDVVANTAAAASGFSGWICTVAGTPGTWKTSGAISA